MIREDCTRLQRTVEDILDMSRAEAHSLALRFVRVPFSRFARRSIIPLQVQAEAANLSLSLTLDEHLGFVQCDPRKLERVITNIVKNAIKFNRAEGAIDIKAFPQADEDGHWICLQIDDTGVGIAPEHLPHITERFYRVGEYVSGSGLGLCISKELIERHGGQLIIESPPHGKQAGTRVQVRLPSVEAPSVLLIYNDLDIRDVISRTMMDIGYSLQVVPLGDAAQQLLETAQSDYIILDWSACDMSGAAVVSASTALPNLAEAPLLVITGGNNNNPARREILHGLNIPVIMAPLTSDTLLNAFDNILADSKI
jgi:two-component system CheB/CheR fusion protein